MNIYIPTRGNPTKFVPIPNPAPPRADAAIEGTNTSRTENVAAAVNAITTTSSTLSCFFGMAKAAIATIIPSTIYLIARLSSSLKIDNRHLFIYYSIIK